MKQTFFFTVLVLISACSSIKESNNSPQRVNKGLELVSPNKLSEVEMLIHENKEFKPNIYVGRGVLYPGSVVPEHKHAASDEILVFEKAAGELIIDDVVYNVKKGEAYFIPKGVKHSYSNRSRFQAEFIQIYNPKGPEKRFLKWAPK